MVLELMTVRLMAPWFGQSQIVWTNVIGVVLAALAVGQWLGGRWAQRGDSTRIVSVLLVAGALSIALPDIIALAAPATLPQDLKLDEAWPFVTYGSLLVALLAVGVPMAALGVVTPWLIRLSREASSAPGRVSGAVLGAGTLGSLAGTFGATHALLPAIGSAWSVRLAGALLVSAGVVLMVAFRSGATQKAVGAFVLPVLLALIPRHAPQVTTLASIETPYQTARVEVDEAGTRLLRINEGLDSFHSAFTPGQLWTERYFDAFVAPALVAPAGEDGMRRVLILGLGGGTMARQIHAVAPDVLVCGVEIDRKLVELGRAWFELPESTQVLSGMDARVALRFSEVPSGAILVDAYAQQIYVPPHLCTEEFFQELRARLLPHGVAALNVGGRTREDPVVAAISGTFARVFPGACMARVPGTRNMIVLGARDGGFDFDALREKLSAPSASALGLQEHLGWMVLGEDFAPVTPAGARPLRDGDAPVEALAHAGWRASS